ncbi:MerR family transcriptional regulator [Schaalia naturae]|jgi:DNA-binding transcriptional MerR regulator|uniref:MerR family transcriptional regulator n=1 Tax=Schaalia naturae TaxID=635203 RepID=A0ABW2SLI1_9ACTO
MLTISQLANYAGVTVKAVRHYHKLGLLPEPRRNHSGYRTYDAAAVVRLIRINVLASSGVPLAQVKEVLDASAEKLTETVQEIDKNLRAEIGRMQRSRKRLAKLAAGDQMALPASVVGYLDRLRGLGVEERYLAMERDAWIMIAAQVPDRIDTIIARKHQDLDDPDVRRLYALVNDAPDVSPDDPRVVEAADILSRLYTKATQSNTLNVDGLDDQFVDLLDDTMRASAPAAGRLMALLEQRGWQGWNRVERVPTPSARPPD